MGVNFVDSLCFVYFFFSLPYNEVVSVFNRHGPRQRRTTKTDSQHWNNKRYRNIQCSIYRQWRTMAFGKGQTWPEEGQRLLNNSQRTQRPPSPHFPPLQHWSTSKRTEPHELKPSSTCWQVDHKIKQILYLQNLPTKLSRELNMCMRKCRKKCA